MDCKLYTTPNGSRISMPVCRSYADVFTLIRSDFHRCGIKVKRLWWLLIKAFINPTGYPLVWLRMSAFRGAWYYLSKLQYKRAMRARNLDIPSETRIGYGFYIGHGIDMVINSGTIIGNNVNLSQFLNIGTNHGTPAYICDNVYVGPMVCIVEDVTIGEGATIGAGAVVAHDIPAECTAVGVPAKVINMSFPRRYIANPWPV